MHKHIIISSPEPKAQSWAYRIGRPLSSSEGFNTSRGAQHRMCVYVLYVCQHFQTSPQKPLGESKSNFIWSLHGMGERKFVQLVQITWPRWPPCPYMLKKFKKSSSLEPKGRWPWNLVCSIGSSSTTKFVQMMTLDWPWPILRQGQIWSLMLLYGKKVKQWIFQKLL